MFCLDTDVLSASLRPAPPLGLVRRLSVVPAEEQFTTAITVGELLYGAERKGSARLKRAVEAVLHQALTILPFDRRSAEIYGPLRAQLEREGQRLEEPDLRIASIALANDMTLVSGNVRHFKRVPGLRLENWL